MADNKLDNIGRNTRGRFLLGALGVLLGLTTSLFVGSCAKPGSPEYCHLTHDSCRSQCVSPSGGGLATDRCRADCDRARQDCLAHLNTK